MTLKEAAAILGVTPDNLRGAISRGSLKARKVGRDWQVTPDEVKRYGQENKRRGHLTDDTKRDAMASLGRAVG